MNRYAPRIVCLALMCIICGTAAFAADLPAFTNRKDKTAVEIHEYKASVELVLVGKKPGNEYKFEFQGAIRNAKGLDLVCVADELMMTSAEDEKGQSLAITKSLARQSRPNPRQDYNAVHDDVAGTELKSTELKANPFTAKEVVVTGRAVVAKKRAEFLIDATVEEDLKDVRHGMKMRLSSMKIDRARVAEITIEYTRPKGQSGAFLEAVYALDAKGNVLGGGRWVKGMGIFSDNMQFKGEFVIARNANIDKFKCVILTDYEIIPLEYIITDIFQR